MCDSTASSQLLTGEASISSAPPLILLQSEEDTCSPPKPVPSTNTAVDGSQNVGNTPSASGLQDTWNLGVDLPEDKNLFSGLTEEHLSRLDDVLATPEVADFLQQNNLGELSQGLPATHAVTPSSSATSNNMSISGLQLPDAGQLSDDSLKLDLFDSQPGGSGLPMTSSLMGSVSQDSLQDYETAIISAAFSDHAYALPSVVPTTPSTHLVPPPTTTTSSPSPTPTTGHSTTTSRTSSPASTISPRKSARIKQRDGKHAFELDSDFEYYFLPGRNLNRDQSQSEQSDADKTSSPAPGSPAPTASTKKKKEPKRRSTRIVDLENREKAEKIIQENRQMEQEAMAAMQKQKEEEQARLKGTELDKDSASSPLQVTDPAKRGRNTGKKLAAGKGKKGKQKNVDTKDDDEDDDESDDDTSPSPQRKTSPKTSPLIPSSKVAKRKKTDADNDDDKTPEKKKKLMTESAKMVKKKKLLKAGAGLGVKGKLNVKSKLAMMKGKKMGKTVPKKKTEESSSEDDDIPLKAIAKIPKSDDSKQKDKPTTPKKTLKDHSKQSSEHTPTKSSSHSHEGSIKKPKPLNKSPDRKRTVSENSEGKSGGKLTEKKDSHKASNQHSGSKAKVEAGKKGDKLEEKGFTKKHEDKGTGEKHGEKGSGEKHGNKGSVEKHGEKHTGVKHGNKAGDKHGEKGSKNKGYEEKHGTKGSGEKQGTKGSGEKGSTNKGPGEKQGEKGSGDKGSGDKGNGNSVKTEDSASSKHAKHKHRKSEEVVLDPTMTDLFKPDGVIPNEQGKKEDGVESTPGKDGPPGQAKKLQGTPVSKHAPDGKTGTPHGRSLSTDAKATPTSGRSLSTEGKATPTYAQRLSTESKATPTSGRSLSTEGKATPTSASQGRSFSMDSKSSHSHGRSLSDEGHSHKKGEERSSFHTQSSKSSNDAGPDKKDNHSSKDSHSSLAKKSGTGQEHKREKKPSASSSNSKDSPHVSSSHIKTEKDSKSSHSHHNKHRRHSQDKASSHSHLKDEKKSHKHTHHPHTVKKEPQVKEERMSLFDVLTKPEGNDGKNSMSDPHQKKDRKPSTEHKHGKGHKDRTHSKDDGHDSDGHLSYEDDENDSDWEPVNDTTTLYCICKKPHGNSVNIDRFMICCDGCGEWYHGQCVGVTKQQGKHMEENNQEYVCPVCSGEPVEQHVKQEAEKPVKMEVEKPKPAESSTKEKPIAGESAKKIRHSTDDTKTLKSPTSGKDKWRPQRCIVPGCKRSARLGSVFCSNDCIAEHAKLALRQIRLDKEKKTGQKITDMRPSEKDRVLVKEGRTGKVLRGDDAPTEAQLVIWLQTHPSFHVLQANISNPATFYGKKDRRSSHGSKKKMEEKGDIKKSGDKASEVEGVKKEEETPSSTQKTEEGPDPVRLNVRRSVRDALSQRAKEAEDLSLSSGEIKRMALRIEEELFKLFTNSGHKYRAKFRSLLFNIKDSKNKGLFRKILTRKIRSSHLVRMSTEELASRELSKWRKMETKHTLEMIKQTEKEAQKEGVHIRKKTHKGEVEVDDEDMSTLVAHLEEPKVVPETKTEEEAPPMMVDTTDQHRTHLFDLNCKICTGRVLPPASEEPPPPKKVRVSHHVMEESKPDKKSKKSKKKGVTIREIKEVKIVDIDPAEHAPPPPPPASEDTLPEEVQTVTPQTTTPSPTSPETVSTPSSSVNSPGPAHMTPSSTPSSQSSTVAPKGSALSSRVTVRSPDSALQSGLDPKHKFTPSGPMVWKGFISMQDFAKFFTSAYRVSGPGDKLGLPDTLQICGRIGPEQMWDYLGKIKQAGSRDVCILRFIPGSDDEKVAYVHLYSYLNSRARCGVVGNPPKYIKDLYIVPLASHSKIPQVLLPFDGPGLEGNRPHMLIGIVVRQKTKRHRDTADSSTPGKSPHTDKKSSAKKMKPSREAETEAYSPTVDDDEENGTQALYIPTPTASTIAKAASTPSSSSSTPSSNVVLNPGVDALSDKDSSVSGAKDTPRLEDAEPYSPSKSFEPDDGDAPYDPEDMGELKTTDKKDTSSTKHTTSSTTPAIVVTTTSKTTMMANTSSLQAPPQPSVVSSTPDIDSVMTQISATTNPEEISSLMVGVLARAKDSEEQKSLLATLTSKVEEKKKLQAEKTVVEESKRSDSVSAGTAPESAVSTSSVEVSSTSKVSTSGVNLSDLISSASKKVSGSLSSVSKDVSTAVPVCAGATSMFSSASILNTLVSLSASISSSAASSLPSSSGTKTDVFSSEAKTDSSSSVTKTHFSSSAKSNTLSAAKSDSWSKTKSSSSSATKSDSASSSSASLVSGMGDSKSTDTKISSLNPDTEDMPLALKALMEDLKGNTQMVRAVDKRTERDRRGREKREASAKEAEAEKKETAKDSKSKDSQSAVPENVIPGFGEAKDEGRGLLLGDYSSDDEEVSSSTDPRPQNRLSPEESLTDTDLRERASAALDQDDRVGVPKLPAKYPPPGSLVVPPQPSSLDVSDIDQRRPVPPPSVVPRPTAPRLSSQPPPPGTVEEDVDMRHLPKRPPPRMGDPPLEKLAGLDPMRLVPPLPPLPPQPPPPLPPLPSAEVGLGGFERGHPAPPPHEPWHRPHEEDYDHRRHHGFPARHHHHHHHHHHPGHSSPQRFRGDGHDRDDRHRRDRHNRKDRH